MEKIWETVARGQRLRSSSLPSRAARCTENIGASRFALYGSGFYSGILDFGSVRTLHCAFKTTMVELENNLSFEARDSKLHYKLYL